VLGANRGLMRFGTSTVSYMSYLVTPNNQVFSVKELQQRYKIFLKNPHLAEIDVG
jgi:hypothetical protein